MTERLSLLLREEAEALDVPPAATGAVLARGRQLRRRRRWTRVAAVAAVTAVVVVGSAAGAHRFRADEPINSSRAAEAFASQGAFAVGRDLYVGDQKIEWPEAIKAIYYTSAGVVVRSGGSSDPDEGQSRYELVTPTGDRSPIDVQMGNRIPGFEPDSTRFAYATQDDGHLEVVVHDVVSDRELARVTVLDHPVDAGWEAPPVSMHGDLVWVRNYPVGWIAVDWRTGAVREVPDTADTYELQNGRYAVQRGNVWEIRAMADGSRVGEVRMLQGWYAFFSPDGNFMRSFPNDTNNIDERPDSYVHDVAAGSRFKHADAGYNLGWTPDGHLMILAGDTVRVCEPMSDACTVQAFDDSGTVRLGGAPYGS
jgi:hypothetical protein